MKRKLTLVLISVLVLALSVFLAACGGDNPVMLKVTAEYDSAQGTVVVADENGNVGESFNAGSKVIVTVTPAADYVLDKFTVNGVDANLNNGVYGFVITANTVVKATFKAEDSGGDGDDDDDGKTPEQILKDAYDSVATTFKADGYYEYIIEGENSNTAYSLTTVFGNDALQVYETNADTGEVVYDIVYVNKDGKIAMPYHTLNNEIAFLFSDNSEDYSDYDNPFKLLKVTDFKATDTKNVYSLAAEKAGDAATALTTYSEKIKDFNIKVSGNKITEINITTDRIKRGSGENELYYTAVYKFTLSNWGTAAVDPERLAPYTTKAEHTALSTALAAATSAQNYTVHIYDKFYGVDDIEYDVYVTETGIYEDNSGWESGYVEKNLTPDNENGMLVYPFRIGNSDDGPEKDGKIVLSDAVDYPTVKSMRASFDGFSPEIFTTNSDGTYVLRDDCIDYVGDVLVNFADGPDRMMLYGDYSTSVKITLKDGALYQVEMNCYVYGNFFTFTLTYSAFNQTTMPITFDDCVKESIFDNYVGTYTDNNIVVKVTTSGITINNYPVTDLSYSITEQSFTGRFNGRDCIIMYVSANQLAVIIGLDSYIVVNEKIEPVEIPADYNGVWADDKGNTVAVAYNKVTFGGKALKVLSYDKDEGLYALRGKVTYRLYLGEKSGVTVLYVSTLTTDITAGSYVMTSVADGLIIPENYVGTYGGVSNLTDYKVVVTLNGVSIEIANKQLKVSSVSVTNDSIKGEVISVVADDVTYVIAHYSSYSDSINLADGTVDANLPKIDDDDPAYVPDEEQIILPEKFFGDYNLLDSTAEMYYYLSISANGILAVVDDTYYEYSATVTEFDADDDFMAGLSINGASYYIFGLEEKNGHYTAINLMRYSGKEVTLDVTLTREGSQTPVDPTPAVVIDEKFYGTYESANGDSIVISESGVTVTLNGETYTAIVKSFKQETNRVKIELVLGKTGYDSLQYNGDLSTLDGSVQKLYLMGNGIITFNRVA